ncbi:putative uncharacterized protein [Clostridium sp. CAG:780]|nr:putative uncharacterized protein [Clostridium sp. CAG:780]
MRNFKSEKGSVSTFVIVTVLFFVAILSTSYMVVAALRKGQLKSQIEAKAVYEQDLGKVDKIVTDLESKQNLVWKEVREENETINAGAGNAYNPTIPAGYLPVDTYNAKWGIGQTTPTTDAVDHGLVIQDKKGNEWVWIPVDSATLTKMIELSGSEKTLCGASVKTSEYSKAVTIGTKTISRTTPGTSSSGSYREPDMVVGALNGGYDAKKYTEILGSDGTEKKLAQLFVDEYGEMIKSITKYGGFYIGRYEISDAGVQKDQKTLINKNWYTLYNKCKELKANDKVETRMIWGIQWDIACDFIANKGDKKDVADSRYWGNYSDSQGDAAVTVTENGKETKKFGRGQLTGYSEYWKANNVYDLAGNYWEWTQEAFYKYYRATRGGVSDKSGSSKSVLSREAISPDNSLLGYISTRPTLIIKP